MFASVRAVGDDERVAVGREVEAGEVAAEIEGGLERVRPEVVAQDAPAARDVDGVARGVVNHVHAAVGGDESAGGLGPELKGEDEGE